jgi:hypothetical protein
VLRKPLKTLPEADPCPHATSLKPVIRAQDLPLYPSVLNNCLPAPTSIVPLLLARRSPGRQRTFNMSSPIISGTIQACVLSATSNIIAQFLTAYRNDVCSPFPKAPSQTLINLQKSFVTDFKPIFQFVLYTILSTPPNMMWYLPRSSPTITP